MYENNNIAGVRVDTEYPSPVNTPPEINNFMLREYRIEIEFLSRGCVINIGCKKIPFESVEVAMEELQYYVSNPYEAQEKWKKILGE